MSVMRQLKSPLILTMLLLATAFGVTLPGGAAPAQQEASITLSIGWMEGRGSPGERGARMAVSQINAAGGVTGPDGTNYRLQLVYPQRPLVVAEDLPVVMRNLVAQQVIAVLGPVRNRLILPNIETLSSSEVPVLTLASADTVTDVDANDNIIRVRAAERFYSRALADVLIREQGFTRIALVQTDVASTEALVLFEQVLQAANLQPTLKLQRPDNTFIGADTAAIAAEAPDVVVMWGQPEDAAVLLQSLRSANYQGVFAYRDVLQAVNSGIMSRRLAEGTIGVGSWVYTAPNNVTRVFLVDFVTEFNQIPDDTEAAAYDAVWILRRYLEIAGEDASGLYSALLQSPPIFTVQGRLEPSAYGNGDVARHVTVYQLRDTGGPEILVRYANDIRLTDLDDVDNDERIIGLIGTITATPTPSFTPSATPTATDTPLPTATPDGVVVIGDLDVVNLRAGPSTDFDIVGQLLLDEQLPVVGANTDYSWLVVVWRGQQVWVSTDVVELFDPANLLSQLPLVDAISVQTPGALVPPDQRGTGPDLVIDSVLLNPPVLIPGQPFVATVLVRNQGNAPANAFNVSTTFQPGNIAVAGTIASVAANSAAGVDLSSVITGPGDYTINIVVDSANAVAETNESNNIYAYSYSVSAPVVAQVEGLTIAPNAPIALTGANPDIVFDGFNLVTQGNARLGSIPGLSYENASLNALDPALLSQTIIGGEQLLPNTAFGVITNEGLRGVIRIDGIISGTAVISYRLFSG